MKKIKNLAVLITMIVVAAAAFNSCKEKSVNDPKPGAPNTYTIGGTTMSVAYAGMFEDDDYPDGEVNLYFGLCPTIPRFSMSDENEYVSFDISENLLGEEIDLIRINGGWLSPAKAPSQGQEYEPWAYFYYSYGNTTVGFRLMPEDYRGRADGTMKISKGKRGEYTITFDADISNTHSIEGNYTGKFTEVEHPCELIDCR